jgi:hypothetical protein
VDPLPSQLFWYCGLPPLSIFLVPWTPFILNLSDAAELLPKISYILIKQNIANRNSDRRCGLLRRVSYYNVEVKYAKKKILKS